MSLVACVYWNSETCRTGGRREASIHAGAGNSGNFIAFSRLKMKPPLRDYT